MADFQIFGVLVTLLGAVMAGGPIWISLRSGRPGNRRRGSRSLCYLNGAPISLEALDSRL